jgi:hypothetical protein
MPRSKSAKRSAPTAAKRKATVVSADTQQQMVARYKDLRGYDTETKVVDKKKKPAKKTGGLSEAVEEEWRRKAKEVTGTSLYDTRREVADMGASNMHRKDAKKWKIKQLESRGVRPQPEQKMNLKMLFGVHRKRKFRQDRLDQRTRDAGLKVKKKRRVRDGQAEDNLFSNETGSFKNGHLKLYRRDTDTVGKSTGSGSGMRHRGIKRGMK